MTDASKITIDDAVLAERSREGDSASMERLILKYQGRIYNVIIRMCCNPEDAAELCQEAFVRAIENIGKYRAASSFYTWIFRIAVNLTIDHCRQSVRLGFRSLDNEVGEGDGKAALREILADERVLEPAEIAEKKELCELIVAAIGQLEDSQRAVLVLRDIEGMSYSEIGQVLEIGSGTVKSRLSRARNNLREIMEAILE